MIPNLRTYAVNSSSRAPLLEFMLNALAASGCRIIRMSEPSQAPFVIVFETAGGERIGVVAYAFRATRTPTKNRPQDERSFQIKYGSKAAYADANEHEIWQDPSGMFTTLLVGIDPDRGYCVSADPVVHSPTKFFIRLEFKDEAADEISRRGWWAWQRIKRVAPVAGVRIETLVGATQERFLDLVRFERAAQGLDPGNRLILAEGHALALEGARKVPSRLAGVAEPPAAHPLAQQFAPSSDEILDLIAGARRLKMAVRGWVAEEHLRAHLSSEPGVTYCQRLDEEGGPDLRVAFRDGPMLTIECKNVAREVDRSGHAKIDFQRTRASKGDPCSRYYKPSDFDVVAACLHAVSDRWDFRYVLPTVLTPHRSCVGRLSNNVRVDGAWTPDSAEIFRRAYGAGKGAP